MILVVGLLNFALGYGLAVALADPPFFGVARLAPRKIWDDAREKVLAVILRWKMKRSNVAADEASELPAERATLPLALDDEMPPSWQQMLRDNGAGMNSLAAGIAHLARLEGSVYVSHVAGTESRARQALLDQDMAVFEQLAADLRFINGDWGGKQRQAADLLEEFSGRHGGSEELAARLSRLLRDCAGQLGTIDREIHSLNLRAEGPAAARRMVSGLQTLLRLAHHGHDEVLLRLGEILVVQGNLAELDTRFLTDETTGLPNRLDLAVHFRQPLADGSRPTRALLMSLDRFGKVNQKLGTQGGDQVLKCVSQLLCELVTELFPSGRVFRVGGDRFLALTHGEARQEMESAGEYLRQSFEAANFREQGIEFSIGTTIGETRVHEQDSLDDVMSRLEQTQAAGIRAGRNRTVRCANGGISLVLPVTMPVVARSLTAEASAL